MNVIIPIQITAAMILAGTSIAEPSAAETAAGHTAWAAATAYAVGDVRLRAETHRKYRCAVAHTSGSAEYPEVTPTKWVDIGPTDRHAPFDTYTSTAAATVTSLTYVLKPGYFNSLALYGLQGANYAITVKDAPGGSVIFSATGFLSEDPVDWYEYLFVAPVVRNKLVFTDIPIRPEAELTITITAATGVAVAVGMIVCGDYTPLIGTAAWGGTKWGASAEPVTYSYIKTNEDGSTTIVRRHAATNLRVTVSMPRAQMDAAISTVQRVLDVPVAWIATDMAGFAGLNTFGLGSSQGTYDNYGIAQMSISVKGFI